MANTYTQIYLQLMFSPKGRENILPQKHKEELHQYITGIVQNRNHKLLAINSMPDHVHLLIGYNVAQSIPDLLRDIKSSSSNFIHNKKWIPGHFQWQEGYGAFSYSRSQIKNVIEYINQQEAHHQKKSFKEEYLGFLKKFEVEFNDEYLFEWIEL